jgi:hypothetical protein
MEKGDPKELELEEELDSLYRKVSSRDQSEEVPYPPQQVETEAPVVQTGAEKWSPQRSEGSRFHAYRIMFALLPVLVIGLITIFYWPVFYHYDALNIEGKVYPLRINRLTGEAAYFDGAEWLRPPIPAEAKKALPEKQITQSAAVSPPEIIQEEPRAEVAPAVPAPSNTRSELKYAIQIKAFPENKKEAAAGFVDDMKKKLPDVRIETVHVRGRGVWHRVLLGNFSTMEEAASYMKETGISRSFRDSFVQKKSTGES